MHGIPIRGVRKDYPEKPLVTMKNMGVGLHLMLLRMSKTIRTVFTSTEYIGGINNGLNIMRTLTQSPDPRSMISYAEDFRLPNSRGSDDGLGIHVSLMEGER